MLYITDVGRAVHQAEQQDMYGQYASFGLKTLCKINGEHVSEGRGITI